jgi:primosomal protein N' (replication factor Y)
MASRRPPTALSMRCARAARRRASPFLLDGVTGSGKTETYFEAVAEAIRLGRQTLVLLPEIALTENFLRRFESRFGVAPILWHSSLKSGERRRAWRAVANGSAQVVVGARSALFLPYAALGLIIVDEAHEISFKQDDGVRYNARDVAVIRARFEQIPVVLASATPRSNRCNWPRRGSIRRSICPRASGAPACPTSRSSTSPSIRPSATTGSPRRWSKSCRTGWTRANSRCCSSTGAAMRR